jgi:hypothetical protein
LKNGRLWIGHAASARGATHDRHEIEATARTVSLEDLTVENVRISRCIQAFDRGQLHPRHPPLETATT